MKNMYFLPKPEFIFGRALMIKSLLKFFLKEGLNLQQLSLMLEWIMMSSQLFYFQLK